MRTNQKTGLVLEGGAMRGLFSSAILDLFMEEGITFDHITGVSAGTTFGINFLTDQPRRALRYCIRYRNDPRFCSIPSLLLTGDMFGAEFCYHTLPETLDPIDNEAFHRSTTPFVIVCTDVNTGRAVYHPMRDLLDREELEWMRAGASMPLASRIVRAGGREMLDGGIADSIPLKYSQYKGCTKNVVILTQPAGYQKSPNRMMPLMRQVYWQYPKLLRAMEHRHVMYNAQLEAVAQAGREGSAFVIRPPQTLPVSHTTHSAALLRAVYRAGRDEGQRVLPALREFLSD